MRSVAARLSRASTEVTTDIKAALPVLIGFVLFFLVATANIALRAAVWLPRFH